MIVLVLPEALWEDCADIHPSIHPSITHLINLLSRPRLHSPEAAGIPTPERRPLRPPADSLVPPRPYRRPTLRPLPGCSPSGALQAPAPAAPRSSVAQQGNAASVVGLVWDVDKKHLAIIKREGKKKKYEKNMLPPPCPPAAGPHPSDASAAGSTPTRPRCCAHKPPAPRPPAAGATSTRLQCHRCRATPTPALRQLAASVASTCPLPPEMRHTPQALPRPPTAGPTHRRRRAPPPSADALSNCHRLCAHLLLVT